MLKNRSKYYPLNWLLQMVTNSEWAIYCGWTRDTKISSSKICSGGSLFILLPASYTIQIKKKRWTEEKPGNRTIKRPSPNFNEHLGLCFLSVANLLAGAYPSFSAWFYPVVRKSTFAVLTNRADAWANICGITVLQTILTSCPMSPFRTTYSLARK